MSLPTERKVTIGFGLALVLLVAVGVISYVSTTRLVDNAGRTTHTLNVLQELEKVISLLKDAESGQRGFIITGQETYLEPYNSALQNLDAHRATLRRLTSDNPVQQDTLNTLDPLITGRLETLRQSIDLRRNGETQAAQQLILSGVGKEQMDNIRRQVDAMEAEENRLLDERNRAAATSADQTYYAIVIGTLLAIIFGALAITIINRDIAARRGAEAALREAHDELEIRVKERTSELAAVNEGLRAEIVERERAEDALSLSEERYRNLVEITPDSISLSDMTGKLVLANARAAEMFGFNSPEEMIGRYVFESMAPEDRPRAAEERKKLANSDDVPTLEYTMVRKDGSRFPADLRGAVVEDARGNPTGFISVLRDITERKETEKRIRRQLDRLNALHNIDLAITSSMDLRVTLDIFLDQVTTHLLVDAADVLLLDAHTQTLDYAAGRGFRTNGIARSHLRLGTGLPGLAAAERKLYSIADLSQEPNFIRADLLRQEEFVSYFAIPLIAKGQVRGVLEIFHRGPLQPDAEWQSFLEALAGQAAIAIDNAELFEGLQRSNSDLALAYDTTLEGWSRALDLRDKETEGHTQRVTDLTLHLARTLGMNEAELLQVRRGALLHDIGKMGIPDSILLKAGPLTDEEWVVMRKHPVYAYELLSPIPFLRSALDIPYCHHEKWDGSGYPRGLKAEQIPLSARIFAVIDVWDALRSDRPYRPAWDAERVREHIRSEAGTHFDPKIVQAFLEMDL